MLIVLIMWRTGSPRPSTIRTAVTDLSLDRSVRSAVAEAILGIVIVVTKHAKAQGRVHLSYLSKIEVPKTSDTQASQWAAL